MVQHEAAGPADRPGFPLVDQVEIRAEAPVQIVSVDAARAEQAPGRRGIRDAGQVEVGARLGDRGDLGHVGIPTPGGNPVIAADVDHEIKITPDASLPQAGDVSRGEAGGGS